MKKKSRNVLIIIAIIILGMIIIGGLILFFSFHNYPSGSLILQTVSTSPASTASTGSVVRWEKLYYSYYL